MKVLLVGDLHRNVQAVERANEKALDNGCDLIFGLGDFGYNYTGPFMDRIMDAQTPWAFIRGNHDDTNWIREAADVDSMAEGEPTEVAPNLTWVPDGAMLDWDGVKVLCVGGAFSIDKAHRVPHVSWWPDELTSRAAEDRAIRAGKADILLAHDVPYFEDSRLEKAIRPVGYKVDEASKHNRMRLREIHNSAQPDLTVHGHFHTHYWDERYRVLGLDMEMEWEGSSVVLDCGGGEWTLTLPDPDLFDL